jgi:UDP-N-acetylmuramate--alanine ligase
MTNSSKVAVDLMGLSRVAPVHFMGIGGVGMAPLADLIRRSGGQVSGCDARPSPTVASFADSGLDVVIGHDPSHVSGASALVVTSAVPADDPEIEAARATHSAKLPRI